MILYNTTFILEEGLEERWAYWVKDIFFTKAIDSGYVIKHHLFTVRNPNPDQGVMYSAQLFFENQNLLENFIIREQDFIINDLQKHFGTKVVFFQTTLDHIF
jgi:hypothetical protein